MNVLLIGWVQNIVSLYADDLLLYISNPVENVPKIVQNFSAFGSFSGYKLHFSKSLCFPINPLALQIKTSSLPFHISGLYKNNFLPLIKKTKTDLQRWDTLYLF